MHRQIERRPHPRPRRRRGTLALLLAAALAATGCTDALRADDDPPPTTEAPRRALQAWPDSEPVASTASPAHPGVSVDVGALLREPDGTTTLPVAVTNDGSSTVDVADVFGFDGLDAARIVDPESRVRHAPVTSDVGYCLCTDRDVEVASGRTVEAYVTFAEVDTAVDAVRVALPEWRPVGDIPVRDVTFDAAPSRTTGLEVDPDREVEVQGVWPVEEGLLVRLEYRNETGEALSAYQFGDTGDLAVVDPATFRLGQARTRDGAVVADEAPEGEVAAGDSFTRDVLVTAPGGNPATVLVRAPGARRTLPLAVGDEAPTSQLDRRDLDDPETLTLEGPSRTESSPVVGLGEVEEIDVDETGPAIDLPGPGPSLTSEAQPEWSVAGRAVIRSGGTRSVLHLDLTRAGGDRSWPEGLGYDLEELALIDPAEQQRLGPLEGSDGTDGSDADESVADRSTRTVHLAFPPVADGSSAVSVDVPGFGTLTDVPVLDGPAPAAAGDPVQASMVDDRSGRLRTDVLALGSLPDDGGLLVRVRRVNVSAPDAYSPTADGLCDLSLSDPETDRRFAPLTPCVTTGWTSELGTGESLVQEVRFPNLPGDVEEVTVELGGWLASAPVAVAEEAAPWYLDLPRAADAPDGDTLTASIGVADDLQSEVREGDEVDLSLDTDVLFAFGSAELTPGAVSRLRDVGARLAGEVSGTVDVVGHTDSVGEEEANQALSDQRAQAVADVLAPVLGSSVELSVEGRGESEPVAANEVDGRDDPDGRSRNRRVTITYSS